ncbi:MAG: SDR family NAD(P)-dependent oxidoreductase [Dehalococcoidales bacterium]|nr:SDR family NAD(P)-dependent oxidoreductase [Dehalococcoidales bacterium]
MDLSVFSLEGKVAVVTGAAGIRGIGRASALALAKAGADIAVCDLNTDGDDFNLEGAAEEVRRLGRRSIASRVDISHENEVNDFVAKVVRELGAVDILVNNAGIAASESFPREYRWGEEALLRMWPTWCCFLLRRPPDTSPGKLYWLTEGCCCQDSCQCWNIHLFLITHVTAKVSFKLNGCRQTPVT